MELFCVAGFALLLKWFAVIKQLRLTRNAGLALDDIIACRSNISERLSGDKKSEWFHSLWITQETALCNSWIGQRIVYILQRQIQRKNTSHLEEDLVEFAEREADRQHDGYGLIRIVTWAMPMLGFLGTVLGISDTLGQMDASALASGSQEAMNNLTAGLYVAFDTTAIGLVTTMVAMFVQFAVNRSELILLGQIDAKVAETLHVCLSTKESQSHDLSNVESALERITEKLLDSVRQVVHVQSDHWKQTIDAAHLHWQDLSGKAAETLQSALTDAIQTSMAKHDLAIQSNVEQVARVQAEGASLIDSRWQQWQTSFSEQARAIHTLQKEMIAQAELLKNLIDKHDAIREMELPVQATLQRLTDIDRFHDAAICLTEAVAVLGTQMERYGYLGRQPLRRVGERKMEVSSADVGETNEVSTTLPLKRRAG